MTKQLLISTFSDAYICDLHGAKLGKFNKSNDAGFGDLRQDADGYVYTWHQDEPSVLSRWDSAGVFQSILYTDPAAYSVGVNFDYRPGPAYPLGGFTLGLYDTNVYVAMSMLIEHFGSAEPWPAEETGSSEIRTIPTDGSTITVQTAHMWAPNTRHIASIGQGYGGWRGIDIAADGSVIYLIPNEIDTNDFPAPLPWDPSYAVYQMDPSTGTVSTFIATSLVNPQYQYVRCLLDGTIAIISGRSTGATLDIYDAGGSLLGSYAPPSGFNDSLGIHFVGTDPFDTNTLWAAVQEDSYPFLMHVFTFDLTSHVWADQGTLTGDVANPKAIAILDVVAPTSRRRGGQPSFIY